jgi:hypothetical protein
MPFEPPSRRSSAGASSAKQSFFHRQHVRNTFYPVPGRTPLNSPTPHPSGSFIQTGLRRGLRQAFSDLIPSPGMIASWTDGVSFYALGLSTKPPPAGTWCQPLGLVVFPLQPFIASSRPTLCTHIHTRIEFHPKTLSSLAAVIGITRVHVDSNTRENGDRDPHVEQPRTTGVIADRPIFSLAPRLGGLYS